MPSHVPILTRSAAGEVLRGANVVVAPGHSARDLYRHLAALGAVLQPKEFAMGFRVEHPQALIDETQFGAAAAALVDRGRGKVPVADYRLSARVPLDPPQPPPATVSDPVVRPPTLHLCTSALGSSCRD